MDLIILTKQDMDILTDKGCIFCDTEIKEQKIKIVYMED